MMLRRTSTGLLLLAAAGIAAMVAAGCTGRGKEGPAATPSSGQESVPGRLQRAAAIWNTNWSQHTIDLNELILGRPEDDPRDVVQPLDNPAVESVQQADEWLEDREPGVLFQSGDEARYYPLRILTLHEIVNDAVAGQPVVITYCPLCNSAVAFKRTVDGQVLRFGTSGLLRFSDLVMWDDASESLWQQITGEAIVGDMAGKTLEFLPSSIIPWSEFKAGFPQGRVLSRNTGFPFAELYGRNPYVGYSSSSSPPLFTGELDERFPALERVVGLTVNGQDKAYPFSVISNERAVNDEVAGVPLVVLWGAADTADALDNPSIPEGQAIGAGVAYERTVNGQALTFKATGDNTFVDEETGSAWNILGLATSGPLAGAQLEPVVHTNHFWFSWAAFNRDDPVYTGGGN